MQGTTNVGSVNLGTVPTSYSIAGFVDFNGDGQTDIVWQNTVSGTRTIWLMNGTTRRASISLGAVNTAWNIAAIGDFNHDGKSDILWQNNLSGVCAVWLMNGVTHASSATLRVVPAHWKIMAAGDFDGDGSTDILLQNNITGACVIWLMNGTTFMSGVTVGVVLVAAEHESRSAQEEARDARENAEQANHAKDTFLANLSHELRTPLTPVLMCVADLEQERAIAPEFRLQLSMMRRNVELEARLIDDLLDMTRGCACQTATHPIRPGRHSCFAHAHGADRSQRRAGKVRPLSIRIERLRTPCRWRRRATSSGILEFVQERDQVHA